MTGRRAAIMLAVIAVVGAYVALIRLVIVHLERHQQIVESQYWER